MTERVLPGLRSMQTGPTSIHRPALLVSTVFAVAIMSIGPIFLLAHTVEERMLMVLTCMPFSGLSYVWAWHECRRFVIRWATVCFASAVGTWFLFFLFFIFETQDEFRGLLLVITNLVTNGVLFWLLNQSWRKPRTHLNEEDAFVV